jgi:hypothetical protein
MLVGDLENIKLSGLIEWGIKNGQTAQAGNVNAISKRGRQ